MSNLKQCGACSGCANQCRHEAENPPVLGGDLLPKRDESLGTSEHDDYANGHRHGWNACHDAFTPHVTRLQLALETMTADRDAEKFMKAQARDQRDGLRGDVERLRDEYEHAFNSGESARAACDTLREELDSQQRLAIKAMERTAELEALLQSMCALWPEDMRGDGGGRIGFKNRVVEIVQSARSALNKTEGQQS